MEHIIAIMLGMVVGATLSDLFFQAVLLPGER